MCGVGTGWNQAAENRASRPMAGQISGLAPRAALGVALVLEGLQRLIGPDRYLTRPLVGWFSHRLRANCFASHVGFSHHRRELNPGRLAALNPDRSRCRIVAEAADRRGEIELAPRRTIGFIVAAGDKSPRTFGAAWRSFPQIRRDDLPSGPILPRIRDIEPRCRFPRGRPPYRAEPLAFRVIRRGRSCLVSLR